MSNRTLADLENELAATQYWLRVLFGKVMISEGAPSRDAAHIRDLIADLKNKPPPPGTSPAYYDRFALDRLPHVDRIGSEIADFLETLS